MPTYEKTRTANGWLVTYDAIKVIKSSELPLHIGDEETSPRYAINLKGANGSGKSSVIFEMLKADPHWVYVQWKPNVSRPIAIYSPRFQTVILGVYLSNCGGCDAIGNTVKVKNYIRLFWNKDVHLIYEGVIVGDIKTTFYELMKHLRSTHYRKVSFCFMGTSLKTCLARVQIRNGGKPVKEDVITDKYKNSMRYLKWYLSQGDVDCEVLNTKGTTREVFQRFLVNYPLLGAPYHEDSRA